MAGILRFLISGMAFATWNPFKYLIGTDDVAKVAATDQSVWTTWDWIKVIFLIVAPIAVGLLLLSYFGIISIFKKKRRRRRRTVVSRLRGHRRVSSSARSRQLAALARGRATRRRNAKRRKK